MMFRKWISVVLSLLLAVALPLAALADTQYTLKVIPGEMLASQQAVADLLDMLSLRLTKGENSGALTVLLKDQEIVTLGLKADANGLYAESRLLGEDVLFVTWDDGFAKLSELMTASMAGTGVDAETLQGVEASLAEAKSSIVSAVAASQNAAEQTVEGASFEEGILAAKNMFPDDPEMAAYLEGMVQKMTVENGLFAAEKRDEADQKYCMVFDTTDLLALCETQYMKNTLKEAILAEKPDASENEIAIALESALTEVKKLYEQMEFEMIMEMYTTDDGQLLCGMDMNMNMNVEENGQKTAVQMTAFYDRQTTENGVSHKADIKAGAGTEVFEISFDLTLENDGTSEGMLGILSAGEETVILYSAERKTEDVCERSFDVYTRSGAAAILEPAASTRPIIGIQLVEEPAADEVLATLEKADSETSVNVFHLSELEMKNLANAITMNAAQVLYTALGQLPTSALQLMMSSGMMGN